MRDRFLTSMIAVAIVAAAGSVVMTISAAPTSAQAPAPAQKTPWGEADLQGLWTDETATPLQTSAC